MHGMLVYCVTLYLLQFEGSVCACFASCIPLIETYLFLAASKRDQIVRSGHVTHACNMKVYIWGLCSFFFNNQDTTGAWYK